LTTARSIFWIAELMAIEMTRSEQINPEDPRKGRKAAQSELTRARIIDAAESMFAACGIEGVSLRQIRVAIGSAHSNVVTYHFGSKESLIDAIIEDRHPFLEKRRAELLDLVRKNGQIDDLNALTNAVWSPYYELTNAEGKHTYPAFLDSIGWITRRKIRRFPVETELATLIERASPAGARNFFEERLQMSWQIVSCALKYCDSQYEGRSQQARTLFDISMRMAANALATP
jgi:AcrR family transcriptional regulator